jgi:hypothetical protein
MMSRLVPVATEREITPRRPTRTRGWCKGVGKKAKLPFTGHLVMENRNILIVDTPVAPATGTAERDVALAMLTEVPNHHRITVGADKAYDTADFVAEARAMKVTPHVARNINAHRGSNIDGRTTRHPGYESSQVIRKRIEEANGWIKTFGGIARTLRRGVDVSVASCRLRPCSTPQVTRDTLNPPRVCLKSRQGL